MPPATPRARPAILIVENSPVRKLMGIVLEKEGYSVLLCDVAGGADRLRSRDAAIDLLITNEPWLFEPFPPGLRVLYVSGAPDKEYLARQRGGAFACLQKPFRFPSLVESVRALLQDSSSASNG